MPLSQAQIEAISRRFHSGIIPPCTCGSIAPPHVNDHLVEVVLVDPRVPGPADQMVQAWCEHCGKVSLFQATTLGVT
jgi:hypothetical protein